MPENDKHRALYHQLSCLLKRNGETILSGQSRLSLSSNCVVILNLGFASIRDNDFETSFEVVPSNGATNTPQSYHDLHFLYDFVQKTPGLKVIHSNATLQGRVDIGAFRSVQYLEIKKTPVHLVVGLQKARSRLRVIICTRCLTSLQDLFESCGGDMSASLSWPELTTAYLAFNNIDVLDDSLKLLSVLEFLDLSHNNIKYTEHYLEYLTELAYLNLGYNAMVSIPSLSISARSKLRKLILKNNCIEHLQGLEELTELRELDLVNNCLDRHNLLQPLNQLRHLSVLNLEGNPLSYHRYHRSLTAYCFQPSAAEHVILDGKPLSKKDRKRMQRLLVPVGGQTVLLFDNIASNSIERNFDSSTTMDDSDALLVVDTTRSKRRTRKPKASKKVREPEISDLETSIEPGLPKSDTADGESQEPHHLHMKEKLEAIRDNLGPDWLQNLSKQRTTITPKVTNRDEESPKKSQENSADRKPVTYVEPDEPLLINDTENDISHLTANDDKISVDLDTTEKNEISVAEEQPESDVSSHSSVMYGQPTNTTVTETKENVINWTKINTEASVIDFGVESEPFIVGLGHSQQQLIVTVTERYLLEKDIMNGDLTELLDLKCLQRIEWCAQPKDVSGDRLEPRLKMVFDYVKKDRRERTYVMEDAANGELFYSLLKPAADAWQAASQTEDMLQCLKCGHEFKKSQAKRHVKKASAGGKADIYSPKVGVGHLEEVYKCPTCLSDMVVEMDSDHRTSADSNQNSNLASRIPLPDLPSITSHRKRHAKADSLPNFDPVKCVSESMPNHVLYGNYPLRSEASETADHGELFERPSGPHLQTSILRNSSTHSECHSQRHKRNSSESDILILGHQSENTASKCEKDLRSNTDKLPCESDISVVTLPSKGSESGISKLSVESSDIMVFRNSRTRDSKSDLNLLSNTDKYGCHRVRNISTDSSDIVVFGNTKISDESSTSTKVVDSHCVDGTPCGNDSSKLITIPPKEPLDGGDVTDNLPFQSLPNETVSSMVSSMYQKNTFDNGSVEKGFVTHGREAASAYSSSAETGSFKSFHDIPSDEPDNSSLVPATCNSLGDNMYALPTNASVSGSVSSRHSAESKGIRFSYADYSEVDHRLKLHLVMELFEDDEDFALLLKCEAVKLTHEREFSVLLVISSKAIYIVKIVGEERIYDAKKWLKLYQRETVSDLQHIDIGPGYQYFCLDFGTAESCFIFLLRDEMRCQAFITQFTSFVESRSLNCQNQLQDLCKTSPQITDRIKKALLCSRHDEEIDPEDVDMTLLKFVMCFLKTGEVDRKGDQYSRAVSLMVTPSHICMAKEDVRSFVKRREATNMSKLSFELQDRQKLTDLTALDIYSDVDLVLQFTDETLVEECSWHLVMQTEDSLLSLIKSLQEPWESAFGVSLQVTFHYHRRKQST